MVPVFLIFLLATSLYAQGDIRLHPDSAFTGQTPALLWTNAVVPFVIDPDIPDPSRFTDAVIYYNANTPLHFQPRVAEPNFVHLVHSTVGNGVCSSSVGMTGGEQFLHVEDSCTTATLIHEMGHTAGFFHEQSRHDRNQHITILYENINKTGYGDFGQNGPPLEQDIGIYDYASHMHYTPFEFSANNLPVMQSVPPGIPLDSYTVLSPGDLDTLFRMYGKAPTAVTLVTNPPGLQMTIDGTTVTSPQVLNWPAGSHHTVSTVGQASGAIRYVFARWSDGGAISHDTVADPGVTFYSADFVQQVPVAVGVAGDIGGTASLDVISPGGYLPTQTVVKMTAVPAAGYTFLRWNGGTACPRANGADSTMFVVASTAINCLATFTQSPVTTVVTDPLNLPVTVDGVSYLQTPVKLVWSPGTVHTIATAAPVSNPTSPARYIFQGWSDGGAAAHSITAGSSSATFTASYKTQYSLVLPSFSPSVASLVVTPASSDSFYDAGSQLQVTAKPAAGWTFFRWTRDLAGQPNPAVLTMDSQKAFSAAFSQIPASFAIVSAADFTSTSVAPGEILTIFAGPADPFPIGPPALTLGQYDSNGKLATVAGDTTVSFNGIPAPVIYASAGQTSVVAPFALTGAGSAVLQLQYGGKTISGNVSLDTTTPGFFTVLANGVGPILAANQDGTLNSAANPARRGSIVTFYATGAGQTNPNGVDGILTGLPLPTLTQPVSVRIGGRPAQLQYAGPAPAELAGVVQVNAVVPLDAPSGNDSVYLVVGLNSSPAGVTLAVQ